jgi:hypothetical protein
MAIKHGGVKASQGLARFTGEVANHPLGIVSGMQFDRLGSNGNTVIPHMYIQCMDIIYMNTIYSFSDEELGRG